MVSTGPTDEGGATNVLRTVLIANRGEIALRIIRGCRAAGVRTVALYSDLDRQAPHVRAADSAVPVGSYLDIAEVVGAAVSAGADAIHPGYGFLSERAEFARAVERAGLKLIGPSAEVMEKMGRKDAAREIAIAAGVPVVPQGSGDGTTDGMVYPVLVKAAAGGGGKGMRIVREESELEGAIAAAKREAASAFGDDTILVEKYVEHGRHIEVQVLADAHGNVVHLFERDCSTQRRHQKVLEEAPAPTITPAIRKAVTEASVALAAHVGYENAGTVEFLLDDDTGEAYFLEMNTRLQVEHPVTELVTGLDLVQLQLLVAAGHLLPFAQEDVTLSGHAIEARVYAEDAFNGFLPQAGVAERVRWSPRARIDAALESGQVVSSSYDPMLGKVIVHGPTREAARRALVTALDDTAILGLTTNLGFLRGLAASEAFRDNEIDTAYLDTHPDVVRPEGQTVASVLAAWALATSPVHGGREAGRRDTHPHPFGAGDGWRVAGPAAPIPVELVVSGETVVYEVDPTGSVKAGDRTWVVHPIASEAGVLRLEIDDLVHEAAVRIGPHRVDVAHQGNTHLFDRPDAFGPGASHAASDGMVAAPMPGTVLNVSAAVGQQVAEGETLGVMEAMKMELALKAPLAGTVVEVGAAAGDQVALGATLFVVEAAAAVEPAPAVEPVETKE